MFSIVTVASSTRMPTASDRPPSVMRLMVSPSAASAMSEQRTESGIETAMISVERRLPRNSRIMAAVSSAAMMPSRTTPETAARTNSDWSKSGEMTIGAGAPATTCGSFASTSSTMSIVDAPPVLYIDSSAPRWPSRRTTLVCGV